MTAGKSLWFQRKLAGFGRITHNRAKTGGGVAGLH